MKLSVNLKLNQSLKLTPLLQQSIKLLQASQNEINALIEEYLKENIFLQIEGDDNNFDLLKKNYKTSQKTFIEEENFFDIFSNQTKNITLKDHLIDNIALFNYSERDQVILYYLIDAINDDGYLLETNLELIKDIPLKPEVSEMEIKSLINDIQSCSLPGIGARSLSECLILQLINIKDNKNLVANAKKIAKEYLNELASNKIEKITKKIGDSEKNILMAINLIKNLNPKPGLAFKKLQTEYINHDLIVSKNEGNWKVYLNDEEFFKIKLNEKHEDLIKNNEFLKEQFQEAKWLVKNLEQRSITILRVARVIMKKQKSFLDNGPHHIKPMILKNIAEELELHESTISRVTTNKFIKTPHGLYELKFFFGREYSENNNAISSKSILAKIKDVILHEDKNKPYSDERIVQLLKEGGITIARRTVTKYREILNILPSNHRKGKK